MTNNHKYGSAEYLVQEAINNINSAVDKFKAEKDTLEKQLKPHKIMAVAGYTTFTYPQKEYRNYYGYIEPDDTVEKCKSILSNLEKHHAEQLKLQEQNAIAIKNNILALASAVAFMESFGLSRKCTKAKMVRGRTKYIESISDWYISLTTQIRTDDGWNNYITHYNNMCDAINNKIRNLTKIENDKIKADIKKKQIAENELRLAELKVRYGLDALSSKPDVLDKILSKNKYLMLAHYLAENRSDWSDGCSKAVIGLDQFVIEDKLDRDIEQCIRNQINNWDGDGRCFRDCEYNYDILFGMVLDTKLVTDYNLITDIINKDKY